MDDDEWLWFREPLPPGWAERAERLRAIGEAQGWKYSPPPRLSHERGLAIDHPPYSEALKRFHQGE